MSRLSFRTIKPRNQELELINVALDRPHDNGLIEPAELPFGAPRAPA